MNDPPADPFGERPRNPRRWRRRLLGADFEFETEVAAVERLVREAFDGLPRYRLAVRVPVLKVRIVVRPRNAKTARRPPPRPRFAGGAGIVTATVDADNYAVVAAHQRSALLSLSTDMLRHPYHLRYELLEFAVIMLAVRTLRLVPMHAACVSLRGRAVLLLGDSGSGKSTLSLHAAAGGLDLVSEDSLFVEPMQLRAGSLPNYLYVRSDSPEQMMPAGLARYLARAEVIRRRSGVRKRALDLRGSPLSVAVRAPRIVAVVQLSLRSARGGRLMSRQSARHALASLRSTQAYAAARPEWPVFSRQVARLPFFHLRRGGHPSVAVSELKALLRKSSRQ